MRLVLLLKAFQLCKCSLWKRFWVKITIKTKKLGWQSRFNVFSLLPEPHGHFNRLLVPLEYFFRLPKPFKLFTSSEKPLHSLVHLLESTIFRVFSIFPHTLGTNKNRFSNRIIKLTVIHIHRMGKNKKNNVLTAGQLVLPIETTRRRNSNIVPFRTRAEAKKNLHKILD